MTQDEFDSSFADLMRAFGRIMKSETVLVYFKRFRGFDGDIFEMAVKAVIDNDERFPAISRLLSVVLEIKHQVLKEKVQRERNKSFLESTGSILDRIPFPKDLKNALDQRVRGKITREDLEEVCRIWTEENVRNPCPRGCSDGYLVYQKRDPTENVVKCLTARCDCELGETVREWRRLPKITEVFGEVPF